MTTAFGGGDTVFGSEAGMNLPPVRPSLAGDGAGMADRVSTRTPAVRVDTRSLMAKASPDAEMQLA